MTGEDVTGDEGFGLVEVLVAFAILASVMIVSLQVFSSGLGQLATAASEAERLRVAQKALAELQLSRDLAPGLRDGTIDGTPWTADIKQVSVSLGGLLSPMLLIRMRAGSSAKDAAAPPLLETLRATGSAP